eukprot:c8743_g1_i1.p1 GENE.c8743_g1_i1~~c8743_g1_i1.p1  ORF type:complete len:945 (+),score=268.65 c8743_g1_i1:188-3022(+)
MSEREMATDATTRAKVSILEDPDPDAQATSKTLVVRWQEATARRKSTSILLLMFVGIVFVAKTATAQHFSLSADFMTTSVAVCLVSFPRIRNNIYVVHIIVVFAILLHVMSCFDIVRYLWTGNLLEDPNSTNLKRLKENGDLSLVAISVTAVPLMIVFCSIRSALSPKVILVGTLLLFVSTNTVLVTIVLTGPYYDAGMLVSILTWGVAPAALGISMLFELHASMAQGQEDAQRKLEKQQEAASNQQKIVGYIFHEVRNPISNIVLACELVRDMLAPSLLPSPSTLSPSHPVTSQPASLPSSLVDHTSPHHNVPPTPSSSSSPVVPRHAITTTPPTPRIAHSSITSAASDISDTLPFADHTSPPANIPNSIDFANSDAITNTNTNTGGVNSCQTNSPVSGKHTPHGRRRRCSEGSIGLTSRTNALHITTSPVQGPIATHTHLPLNAMHSSSNGTLLRPLVGEDSRNPAVNVLELPAIDEVRGLVDDIHQSASAAVRVLNDALNIQKLQSGAFEFAHVPFRLEDLVLLTVRMVQAQMRIKSIRLESMIDPDLRGVSVFGDFHRLQQVLLNYLSNAYKFTPEEGVVAVRMARVADNDDTVDRCVWVRTSVFNSGTPIQDAERSKIFQPWSQIRAKEQQQGQGSGLGLALCKAFVEKGHQGHVGFNSHEGQGTDFYFEIPFRAVVTVSNIPHQSPPAPAPSVASAPIQITGGDAAAMTTHQSQRAHQAHHTQTATPVEAPHTAFHSRETVSEAEFAKSIANLRFMRHTTNTQQPPDSSSNNNNNDTNDHSSAQDPHTGDIELGAMSAPATAAERRVEAKDPGVDVLVVEDSAMSRRLMAKTLRTLGLTSDQVVDGVEAVERVKSRGIHHYSVILMDKEMPRMDGLEATRLIRELGFPGVIIGCTGNVLDDQVTEFLREGANHVLGKPVSHDVVAAALHQYGLLCPQT